MFEPRLLLESSERISNSLNSASDLFFSLSLKFAYMVLFFSSLKTLTSLFFNEVFNLIERYGEKVFGKIHIPAGNDCFLDTP